VADLYYFSQFPHNASADVNLGNTLASKGHLEEGIAKLTKGIEPDPESAKTQ
jgi:hypothetical protein